MYEANEFISYVPGKFKISVQPNGRGFGRPMHWLRFDANLHKCVGQASLEGRLCRVAKIFM